MSDVREVYWDVSRPSAKDGRNGAYVSLEGGRRFGLGELDRVLTVAPKPS